jgi:hypothetical protein
MGRNHTVVEVILATLVKQSLSNCCEFLGIYTIGVIDHHEISAIVLIFQVILNQAVSPNVQ